MTAESVEKAAGSNPRGEEVRSWPLDGTFGSTSKDCDGTVSVVDVWEEARGEKEEGDLIELSLTGGTDSSSGFAIRRPPRDWDRLKSPSMADG